MFLNFICILYVKKEKKNRNGTIIITLEIHVCVCVHAVNQTNWDKE